LIGVFVCKRKANANCLDDESNPGSSELNFERSNRLPGEQYPPNKQCQLALGSQYTAYTSTREPFNVSILRLKLRFRSDLLIWVNVKNALVLRFSQLPKNSII
jgi:hypothetical protein